MIELNIDNAFGKQSQARVNEYEQRANSAMELLHSGEGEGGECRGWLKLPSSITDAQLDEIEKTAALLRQCKIVVVIGIGGSYLGAKAVVEALSNSFDWLQHNNNKSKILFAGHHISEDYLAELCETIGSEKFSIINISKSGTTTEPGIAFRLLKGQLEANFGKEVAKDCIVAITDETRGALRTLAMKEGYKTFVIPNDVGGRFSVFTPASLLPIAIAGISIRELLQGALSMEIATNEDVPFLKNIASTYAATRYALYKKEKKIEILANFHPKMHYIGEWWKQLFGESEGKDKKGIFPASADFTTDLHSLGQWIQDGERIIFETVISIKKPALTLKIPMEEDDLDGLNYLAGMRIDDVNKKAEEGTQMAHVAGGVPNLKITMPELNAYYIGQLLYFFEKACGISGYMLGVNPFDQPGVEAYKNNMFDLLRKPIKPDK